MLFFHNTTVSISLELEAYGCLPAPAPAGLAKIHQYTFPSLMQSHLRAELIF